MKRRKKINNNGTTLIEMIVSFVLIGIFVVAASHIITSGLQIYYNVKGTAYGQQVSQTILEKISGSIEGAKPQPLSDSSSSIIIDEENGTMRLIDRTGSEITISVQDKLLNINYAEVKSPTGDLMYKSVDWKFDKKVYMGYEIENLNISYVKDNIFLIELNLHSSKYGDYKSKKYVKCNDFAVTDYGKIN